MTTSSKLYQDAKRSSARPVSAVVVLLFAVVTLILASCNNGDDGNDDQNADDSGAPGTPTSTTVVSTAVSGVFEDRIVFGQSAAFSGPAGELGRNMRIGIEAAFQEINDEGGVHGRKLELVSLDDSYEPEAAIANTKRSNRRGGSVRVDRRCGNSYLALSDSSRIRCKRALHCAFHRCRIPA